MSTSSPSTHTDEVVLMRSIFSHNKPMHSSTSVFEKVGLQCVFRTEPIHNPGITSVQVDECMFTVIEGVL